MREATPVQRGVVLNCLRVHGSTKPTRLGREDTHEEIALERAHFFVDLVFVPGHSVNVGGAPDVYAASAGKSFLRVLSANLEDHVILYELFFKGPSASMATSSGLIFMNEFMAVLMLWS